MSDEQTAALGHRTRDVRIVHISDLHCVANDRWAEQMQPVRDSILDLNPDLILATGDLMNNPRRKSAKEVGMWIRELCRDVQATYKSNCYAVCVPGNHDKWLFFGNRVFFSGSRVWHRFAKKNYFHFPNTTSLDDVLSRVFSDLNVSLFPFDSNKVGLMGFARGSVKDINRFNFKKNKYKSGGEEHDQAYEDSTKIAMLHHHVLPLPNVGNLEKRLEAYMLLDNSYAFLNALLTHKIDLVLHGHKHRHGVADYRGIEDDKFSSIKVVASGCSSPAKVTNPEFGVIDINTAGLIEYRRFCLKAEGARFEAQQPLTLRDIGRVRQNYAKKGYALPDIDQKAVKRMRHKRKHMQLAEDGTAYVRVFYEDIEWKDGIDDSQAVITDYLRGDVGRIRGSRSALYAGAFRVRPDRVPWERPGKDTDGGLDAMAPDGFFHTIRSPGIDTQRRACAELEYQIINGFCMFEEDHKDIYGPIGVQDEALELCSIEANAETELLELSVSFPDLDSYPTGDSVFVRVWKSDPEGQKKEFALVKGGYPRLHSEERFLVGEAAVQFRPELRQVGVTVRHPQPGATYSLCWRLKKYSDLFDASEQRLPAAHQNRIEAVRREFLHPGSDRVKQFLEDFRKKVVSFAKDYQPDSTDFGFNETTEILAFGLDFEQGCFCLSIQDQLSKPIRLGRGVIGAAWRRLRPVVYVVGDESLDRPEPEDVLERVDKPNCMIALPIFLPDRDEVCVRRETVVGIVGIIEHGENNQLAQFFDPAAADSLGEDDQDDLEDLRFELANALHWLAEEEVSICFV